MALHHYQCNECKKIHSVNKKLNESLSSVICCNLVAQKIYKTVNTKSTVNFEGLSQDEINSLMRNREYQERLILEGVRQDGIYAVKEQGPEWSRPFGNDKHAREKAQEQFNLGIIKYDDHLPGVESDNKFI